VRIVFKVNLSKAEIGFGQNTSHISFITSGALPGIDKPSRKVNAFNFKNCPLTGIPVKKVIYDEISKRVLICVEFTHN
jgi:hypothetical protein